MIRLLNSTGNFDEGEVISICIQLEYLDGGLQRPLSVSAMIHSGTAECESIMHDSFIIVLLH